MNSNQSDFLQQQRYYHLYKQALNHALSGMVDLIDLRCIDSLGQEVEKPELRLLSLQSVK